MANVRAFRTGNWSDTTSTSPWWNGSAIFAPASGDVVYANNFTITVDSSQNIGSGTVTNAAATSILFKDGATANATAGGTFSLANGVTLTAATAQAGTASFSCITFSLNSPNSATFVGNLFGGTAGNSAGANITGTGTLTVIGNATGGSVGGTQAAGVNVGANGVLNLTGNVYGGTFQPGIYVANNGASVNVTGNCYAGASSAVYGLSNASVSSVSIIGNCYAGSANSCHGVNNGAAGTINITGNCFGGSVSGAYGVNNVATGSVVQNGVAFASNVAFGASNFGTGSYTLTKAVGNGYGPGTSGIVSFAGAANNTTGNFYISQLQFGALGQSPTSGCFILTPSTSNTVQFYKSPALPNISSATWTSPTTGTITFAANHGLTTGTQIVLTAFQDPTASWNRTAAVTVTSATQVTISGPTSSPTVIGSATLLSSTKTLVDASATAGVIPSASDVRFGVAYNAGSNIGTCYVPSPSNVDFGTPVDATTGTAVLSQASVITALTTYGASTLTKTDVTNAVIPVV